MVRSPERLRLRCDHCRRETPGWALTRREGSRPPLPVTTLSEPRGLSRLELSEHVWTFGGANGPPSLPR
jgi:hypothetical protein